MIDYNLLFKKGAFKLSQIEKEKIFFDNISKLNIHHKKNCKEFKLIANSFFPKEKKKKLEELPFIHVRLFKEKNLSSVKKGTKISTYNSSGTSNTKLSKINIDRFTSLVQSKSLLNILMTVLKTKRKKIYFLESEKKVNEKYYSAKGAAINGFKQFADKAEFLLDKNEKLNFKSLKRIKSNEKIIFFGFTNMVWEKLIKTIIKKKIKFNFKNSILFHGGGWKKLEEKKIRREKLYGLIHNLLGINQIYDYYGMIEQTGSIFLECEYGYYHASIFSEINVRNSKLEICKSNQKGIIQVSSLLPTSYPGHNILTEDLGEIKGIDNCKCGRKGKYFKIHGRLSQAEIRGCSNV
tara:strand:- start:199 stop:1248 length:1050 start_codon:yes stop_codon:yes gene_type:complete